MEKKEIKIVTLLVVVVILIGGGAWYLYEQETEPKAGPGERTVTDPVGRTVVIPEKIERVGVLNSPSVQLMYLLHAEDKICSITKGASTAWLFKIDPHAKELPVPRKCAGDLNVEMLLEANPDICIGGGADAKLVEPTGIPVLYLDAYSFEGLKKTMTFLGDILGKEREAKEYNDYLDETVNEIEQVTSQIPAEDKVKMYFGFYADTLTTYGGDTYIQERVVTAGGLNAAESISGVGGKEAGLNQVSYEQVLAWNPEVIVVDKLDYIDTLKENDTWAEVAAVKNNRMHVLPSGLFIWNRPSGEAAVLCTAWLAKTLYPDKFPNLSIEAKIKEFYTKFFNYDLTDEEVQCILHPTGSPWAVSHTAPSAS